jgi:quinol monooxygenase YgiN
MIYVIATVKVKPGTADAFADLAAPCIAATRQEAGNISYDLNRREGEADMFVFVESWESRDHLQAHFETAHMATYRNATKDLVAERKIEIIEPAKVDIV